MAGRQSRSSSQSQEFPCTKEEIVQLRDVQGMAWKNLAEHLNLRSPSGRPYGRYAKEVYSALTGVPYDDLRTKGNGAPRVARPRSRAARTVHPHWNDDTDQGEIEDALAGTCNVGPNGDERWQPVTIHVRRSLYGTDEFIEEIPVRYVTAFTYGPEGDQPLQVEVVEHMTYKEWQGTRFRTFYVDMIEGVSK